MRSRRSLCTAVLLAVLTACTPTEPPDISEGVPIADRSGQQVGTAEPEAVERAEAGGEPAPVYSDGELVGHFHPEGFDPID